MANLQQLLATGLRRRTELLPREIDAWNRQSDANKYGMGLHQSQVRVVTRLFSTMLAEQNALKEELDPKTAAAMPQDTFTSKRMELEQMLTGSHSIMATFRHIFSQRDATQPYGDILAAADLVAAACYLPCVKLYNRWKGLPDENYREPPLTYLNAKLSPAAITRRHYFGSIGLELQGEEELQLPLSIISLAFHDTTGFWELSSIYHEVGHLLTQDLKLRDDLKKAMETKLAGRAKLEDWKRWLNEMIADAFGVLLGGAGFARGLVAMLYKTREEVLAGSGVGEHPNSYVRVFLLGALLRRTGVAELQALADTIEGDWRNFYGPANATLKPYADDCGAVAEVLMVEPLSVLEKDRCLLDFSRDKTSGVNSVADLEKDYLYAAALARFIRLGKMGNAYNEAMLRPADLIRLVPAAAQLAVQSVEAEHEQEFAGIDKAALELTFRLQKEARIEFLAGEDTAAHAAYLDGLIRQVNFKALRIDRP